MKIGNMIKLYGQKAFSCCLAWLLVGAVMTDLKNIGFNASENVSYVVVLALWAWIFFRTSSKD
jgi:hypothetical protein